MKKPVDTGDVLPAQQLALLVSAFFEQYRHAIDKKIHHLLWYRTLLASTGVVLLVSGVWVAGNIFGVRYDIRGTVLSARSSDARISRVIQDQVQGYRLKLVQPDGKSYAYTLQDMGLQIDVDGSIAQAHSRQHTFSSQLQWWRPIPIKLTVRADSKALQRFITEHATIVVTPAKDASLTITDGETQLIEGTNGIQYGFASPTSTILEAASTMQANPLYMRQTTQRPLVSAKSLATTKNQLDAALKQPVTISIEGEEIKPSLTELSSWITYTPGTQDKPVEVAVNAGKVEAYIDELANDHSHPPRAQVSLGGAGVIPGSAGTVVGGKDEAVATIKDKLLSSHGLQVTLPVQHQAFKTISATPAAKWIEVDLTNKRMYAYQQTDMVRSFLVSAGAPGTPTVTGTYAIYSKYTKQTMSGANADGSHYVQPNVPWVNYFYRDYAIHGNYWRPNSYFGNINSSHGCVGVTPGDGAWVYNWAPVGTPVVVHT